MLVTLKTFKKELSRDGQILTNNVTDHTDIL